jgi:hypothetical protein
MMVLLGRDAGGFLGRCQIDSDPLAVMGCMMLGWDLRIDLEEWY